MKKVAGQNQRPLDFRIQSIKGRLPAQWVNKPFGDVQFPGKASSNSSAFKTCASSLASSSSAVISLASAG
jgi:hypothetical protein